MAADYVLAGQFAADYREALIETWHSLPDSARAESSLPQQATEILTWARGMTIVHRAMLAEQLAALDKAIRYTSDATLHPRSMIQVSF